MANSYYSGSGYPGYRANGDSASARSEFAAIVAAFDKLPTLSGTALHVVRVNAAGTALEAVTLNSAKILATDGSSTVTANIPMSGFKLTGIGAATANGDAVRYEQVGDLAIAQTHAATSKTTPADADEIPLSDSAASFAIKKLTWANLRAALNAFFVAITSTTGAAVMPTGTTAERPAAPSEGHFRRNSELAQWEGYDGAQWSGIGGASGGGGNPIMYAHDNTITQPFTLVSGQNAGSFGEMTFSGAGEVTVEAGAEWVVVG